MKKIENIIESCRHCRYCQKYVSNVNYGEVWLCGHEGLDKCDDMEHFIAIAGKSSTRPIPEWCPLETYKEAEKSKAKPEAVPCYIGQSKVEADQSTPSTIILHGMPSLEWMTENLTGHGGTEVDGRWYYTWDEAMDAAKQLGDGWRIPTIKEFEALCDLGSTWDAEHKGRWFGGNHDTDHEGSLFFPASGCRSRTSGALADVGSHGYSWSSSPSSAGSAYAGYLNFYASGVNPFSNNTRALGFPVRCVRDISE